MTTLPFKLSVDPAPMQFLLTVRGEMAPPNLEAGRKAHNLAAGSDQGVAAARSFGDLSHAVYVPVEPAARGAGELLIIDYWNSPRGCRASSRNCPSRPRRRCFFREREAVLWQGTPGLPRVSLPAPAGRNERYVGIARGPVGSREGAEKILTEAVRKAINTARAKGLMSREWYFRAEPARREAVARGDRRRRLVRRRRHAGGLFRPGRDGRPWRPVHRRAGDLGVAEAAGRLGGVVGPEKRKGMAVSSALRAARLAVACDEPGLGRGPRYANGYGEARPPRRAAPPQVCGVDGERTRRFSIRYSLSPIGCALAAPFSRHPSTQIAMKARLFQAAGLRDGGVHGAARDEVRRHLRRRHRAHPECRRATSSARSMPATRSRWWSRPWPARPTSSSPGRGRPRSLHDAREYDAVVASGEQVTAGLLAIALQEMGVNARSWQGWQIPIRPTTRMARRASSTSTATC